MNSKLRQTLSFIILFSLSTLYAQAQVSTVSGRIISAADSSALAGATILSLDGKLNTMCDAEGRFTLKNVPRRTTYIEVHLLGYEPLKYPIELKHAVVNLGDILLKESKNEIDAVVVKSRAPIAIQRGDTTQFNAEAFKTQPDADADDLLAKMPGVVIIDGKIEAQGEPVRKIYVDGRLLFGTDPMTALKSVPANAIESIQLFDEPSEMARYSGFDDGQTQKAINIVTKNKSRTTTIFKGEASGGTDIDAPRKERYMMGGTFSHSTDKQRLVITGLGNNINISRFNADDSGSGYDSNGNPTNQSGGLKKIYGGGANYAFENKSIKFSGSYMANYRDELTTRERHTEYFPNPPKYDSKSNSSNSRTTTTAMQHNANFRLEWNPNKKNVFVLSPRASFNNYDMLTLSDGLMMQDGDSVSRNARLSPSATNSMRVSGEAMWTHRFNKKGRSVTTSVSYNFDNRDSENYNIDSLRQVYSDTQTDTPKWSDRDPVNQLNDQYVENNGMKFQLRYAEPFAKYHRILFNAGWENTWGSSDKQSLNFNKETQDYTNKNKNQSSNFKRDYTTLSAGLGYSFVQKKYLLNMAADFQRLGQQREEFEPNITDTKMYFSSFRPSVTFRYSLEKSKYLRAQYVGRSVIPRIEQMQNVMDISSPNNIRIGNPDLRQGYEHRLSLFYNASNIARSTNFSLMLNATTQSNYAASETESMPHDRDTTLYINDADKVGYVPNRGAFVVRQINLDGYVSARTEATYSFTLSAIRSNVNLTAGYGYVRMPSKYQVLNFANTHTGNIRLGITSNISEKVDFNLYSLTSLNRTINSSKSNSSYLNQDIHYAINVIFWKGLVFNSHFTWKYYTSTSTSSFSNSYYLLNVGVGKRMFRRNNGEFRITAYDLLNQNRSIQYMVQNNNVSYTRSNSLGRYVMARFSYRFNSMSRRPMPKNAQNVQDVGVKEFKKSMRETKKQ